MKRLFLFLSILLMAGCNLFGDSSPTVSCDDNILNGTESDIDCGGSCSPCEDGKACLNDVDCESGACGDRICVDGCEDQTLNGNESDIDCGGSCDACDVGQICRADADCGSNSCVRLQCQIIEPGGTCTDQTKNNSETDVDCGGNACPMCADGRSCFDNQDCASNLCENEICQTGTPSRFAVEVRFESEVAVESFSLRVEAPNEAVVLGLDDVTFLDGADQELPYTIEVDADEQWIAWVTTPLTVGLNSIEMQFQPDALPEAHEETFPVDHVAVWLMDGLSDRSGNGYALNGEAETGEGFTGLASSFTGNNSLSVNGTGPLNEALSSPFTVTFVAKTRAYGGEQTIIVRGEDEYDFWIGQHLDHYESRMYFGASMVAFSNGFGQVVAEDAWMFGAVVYTGDEIVIWVNDAEQNRSDISMRRVPTTPTILIGDSSYDASFLGEIDDIRVISRAVSNAELSVQNRNIRGSLVGFGEIRELVQ